MGTQQHVIGDLRFEFNFPSQRVALAEQGDIIAYIKSELLPLADKVFDDIAADGQTVRLDELEIDIGEVSHDSMRDDIAQRFGKQLRSALARALQPTPAAAQPVARRMSSGQSELGIVQHFLSRGVLPWQATVAQFDALLMRVLRTRATDVVSFLRSQSSAATQRLLAQTPEAGLTILLAAFFPDHRESLARLVAATEALLHSAATSPGARRQIWAAVIRQLASLRVTKLCIDAAIKAVQRALAAEDIDGRTLATSVSELEVRAADSAKPHGADHAETADSVCPDEALPDGEAIAALLSRGDFAELKQRWAGLIGPQRPRFQSALRQVLGDDSARARLVAVLEDDSLADVVTILAPAAADWIVRVVSQRASPVATATAADGIRLRLWDYSIASLVADRGGRFNKLSYLESVLRRMAAHDNLDYPALLEAVASATALPGALSDELRDLVRTLAQRQGVWPTQSVDAAGSAAPSPDVETLAVLLSRGRGDELTQHWPGLIGPQRHQFEAALRVTLRRSDARRMLVSALSGDYLADVVTVLAPDAADWIVRVVTAPQAFVGRHATEQLRRNTLARLWDYSIAFLVAQRGRPFDKMSYLESVLQRIGAHDNLDYATVLAALASNAATPGTLRIELAGLARALATRWKPADRPTLPQDAVADAATQLPADTGEPATAPDVEAIRTLIERGLFGRLTQSWALLTGPQRPQFETALRVALRRRRARRTLVGVLDDKYLADVVGVLAPDAAEWIVRVVAQPDIFRVQNAATTEPVSSTTKRLWDYSIACLVVDRGTRFNKTSYMESLLRQMAAHDNLHYTAVLESISSMLDHPGLQPGQHQELVEIVRALAQRESAVHRRPDARRDGERTAALETMDILRDFVAGRPGALADAQIAALLEELPVSYRRHLLRELSNGLDPGNRAVTVEAIISALKAAAARVRSHTIAVADELDIAVMPSVPAATDDASLSEWQAGNAIGKTDEPGIDARPSVAAGDDVRAAAAQPQPASPEVSRPGADSPPDDSTASNAAGAKLPVKAATDDTSLSELQAAAASENRGKAIGKTDEPGIDAKPPVAAGEKLPVKAATDDEALLQALTMLRQLLRRWPEHARKLLLRDVQVRSVTGDWASLRSALDTFLTNLNDSGAPSAGGLRELVDHLAAATGMTVQFWQRRLGSAARGFDNALYPQAEPFAALRLTLVLAPDQEAQPAKYYATVVDRFEQHMQAVRKHSDAAALEELRALFESRKHTLYLVNSLGLRSLSSALARLFPRDHAGIRYLTEVMTASALFPRSYLTSQSLRRTVWLKLFERLIGQGEPFSTATLARHLAQRLLSVIRTEDAGEFVSRLRARLPRAARQQDWLSELARPDGQLPGEEPPAPPSPDRAEQEDATDLDGQVFVTNAGIVLLAPYLPRLFAMFELTSDEAFVNHAAAERAAHLLQFAVTGNTDAPEYELALNKLLCGIPFGRPLTRELQISDTERQAVGGLLEAVIQHWRALGNTSVDGLRSSFFQREGRLRKADNGWHLLVESRSFDMLLDNLPWSYKVIRYPWMDGVLHVEWR